MTPTSAVPMIKLSQSLNAWGTSGFEDVLKAEIEQLDVAQLPLQQGLALSSYATDSPRKAVIIGVADDEKFIHVTAGIFYSGIIAGCSCEDDPTPVDEVTEYCKVRFEINKQTAETTAILVEE